MLDLGQIVIGERCWCYCPPPANEDDHLLKQTAFFFQPLSTLVWPAYLHMKLRMKRDLFFSVNHICQDTW